MDAIARTIPIGSLDAELALIFFGIVNSTKPSEPRRWARNVARKQGVNFVQIAVAQRCTVTPDVVIAVYFSSEADCGVQASVICK